MHLLRLRQAVEPGDRRPRRGFGGERRHDDLARHSRTLQGEVDALRVRHQARPKVLGVDPKLVVIVELGAAVDEDDFRKSGLLVLDSSDSGLVVAFADDPQLAGFMDRLAACARGVPSNRTTEPYAAFVDAIDKVRPVGPADRISPGLADAVVRSAPGDILRLDAELWHPDNRKVARDWVAELREAVKQAGGRIADDHVNDLAGIILARIYAPASQINTLAELDTIAVLDVLPTPALTLPQFWATGPGDLPDMASPRADAPVVGLVDSGVASAHPLVGPAVAAAEALSAAITDGEDRCGHGTMVAGLILHGPLDQVVANGIVARPLCRIVSVAVLDSDNRFPDADLWERDLVEAIEWCASQGASIINLSLGDDGRPLRSPRQHPAAALVDELARRLDLVVVAAVGNSHPQDYLSVVGEESFTRYPVELLADARTGIIDPGTAALALTVGGITTSAAAAGYNARETVLRRPLGEPGWPSPITRRGPGIGGAVKPEVVERSGTLGIESDRLVDNDPELGVIGARLGSGRLLGYMTGTSAAAPLVTRIAAAVKARHPGFSANLIRALVLLSARSSDFASLFEGAKGSARAAAARNLGGFGQPEIARAIESTTHRAVLVAESSVPVNGVHIYELPIPGSFMASGGVRGIDVALAYNPRTRQSRLDYLSNRIDFALIRGMSLDKVIEVVAKIEGDEDVDLESGAEEEPGEGAAAVPTDEAGASTDKKERARPPTLSQLGSKVVKLEPSSRVRSAGANQLGRAEFRARLDAVLHVPMFVVVRDVNRWEDDTASQPYALAVAMWRSAEHAELYAELEEQLEVIIELPVEVELEF